MKNQKIKIRNKFAILARNLKCGAHQKTNKSVRKLNKQSDLSNFRNYNY